MDWKRILLGPPNPLLVIAGVLIGAVVIFVIIGLNR